MEEDLVANAGLVVGLEFFCAGCGFRSYERVHRQFTHTRPALRYALGGVKCEPPGQKCARTNQRTGGPSKDWLKPRTLRTNEKTTHATGQVKFWRVAGRARAGWPLGAQDCRRSQGLSA